MGRLRREVGFWGAVGRLRLVDLVAIENVLSLGIGGAVGLLLYLSVGVSARVDIAGDFLAISAALLGVVVAAMALVTALLSDSYVRLLSSSDSGVLGFFSPFVIAIGIQLVTVMGSVGYRAFGALLPSSVEPWVFGTLCVFFLASCFEVLALARSVLMHALLRATHQEVTDIEVERIKKRRGAAG